MAVRVLRRTRTKLPTILAGTAPNGTFPAKIVGNQFSNLLHCRNGLQNG